MQKKTITVAFTMTTDDEVDQALLDHLGVQFETQYNVMVAEGYLTPAESEVDLYLESVASSVGNTLSPSDFVNAVDEAVKDVIQEVVDDGLFDLQAGSAEDIDAEYMQNITVVVPADDLRKYLPPQYLEAADAAMSTNVIMGKTNQPLDVLARHAALNAYVDYAVQRSFHVLPAMRANAA